MAYLGKPAGNRATGTSKDSFNGDGSTTAFTMTKTVHLVTDIEVFVDNVQQEPTTAYTISGTTLTFDEAPPNGTANVYVIHRSGNNDSMTIQSGITPTFQNVIIANNGNFGVDTANGVLTNVAYSEGDIMMLDVSIKAVDDGTDELLIVDLSD